MKRKVIQLLVLTIIISMLSGCAGIGAVTNGKLGEFRGVAFGTKFKEAKNLIDEDLKKQDYDEKGNVHSQIYDNTYYYDYYYVKLYDYYVTMKTKYYLVTDNIDESIFYGAEYIIDLDSKEEAVKCFNDFYSIMKEKYGKTQDESLDTEKKYAEWDDGNAAILMNLSITEYNNLKINTVHITYYADKVEKDIENIIKNNEEKLKESINSGL